jgi:hypothetical protein
MNFFMVISILETIITYSRIMLNDDPILYNIQILVSHSYGTVSSLVFISALTIKGQHSWGWNTSRALSRELSLFSLSGTFLENSKGLLFILPYSHFTQCLFSPWQNPSVRDTKRQETNESCSLALSSSICPSLPWGPLYEELCYIHKLMDWRWACPRIKVAHSLGLSFIIPVKALTSCSLALPPTSHYLLLPSPTTSWVTICFLRLGIISYLLSYFQHIQEVLFDIWINISVLSLFQL